MTFTVGLRTPTVLAVASASAWPSVGRDTCAFTKDRIVVVQGRGDRALAEQLVGREQELSSVLADDQQALVLDRGRTRAHTGSACWPHTSQAIGPDAVALSNCSSSPDVAQDMLAVVHATSGNPVDRVLQALALAASQGGDARGVNSAHLVLAVGEHVQQWRVDWAESPIDELRSAVDNQQALEAMYRGEVDVATLRSHLRATHAVIRFWAAYELHRRGERFSRPPLPNDGWVADRFAEADAGTDG